MKIKEILINGINILKENKINNSNLKVKIVLADLINKPKEYLMIHEEEEVPDNIYKIFLEKIERLKNHEPIQYVINKQEFMGFEFYVDNNVLIPQPDTENLVEEVILLVNKIRKKEKKILDLCTGSGAIGISLAKILNINKENIYCSDISEKAIEVAKKNALQNNIDINFLKSDLFENFNTEMKFDVIVSNPPYIETNVINTLDEEVQKEPHLALDGGKDGLDFYRKIIENAKYYLNEKGYLALEIGYNQKKAVEELFKSFGYIDIYSKQDLSGNDRIVVGKYSL